MPRVAPTTHKPPAFRSRWRRAEKTSTDSTVYVDLDPNVPTKAEAGGVWREGLLYAREDPLPGPGPHTFHRTLEAFYAEMEPAS